VVSRIVIAVLILHAVVGAQTPSGSTATSSDAQAQAEKVFLDTPTPNRARQWLAQLTEDPHVAGTPQEKALADFVLARFKEFGLDAEIRRYDVFLNHPAQVSLALTAPVQMELSLREEPIAGDKDSSPTGMFPAFHGYGASGTAAGQVVYVNYGSPADFERLQSMGISVAGKVTLVRYGGAFRGLKVKESQDRGAIGVLIYSDPADDGYMRGDVYPDGPMRPPSAIQRGSVQYLSIQPGDPSTPGGVPSIAGATRIGRERMNNVPRIPSLPISYQEAEKILRHLAGPRVPDDWQGGLPFSYHVGPGAAAVAMDVRMDEGLKPIYNVIATIKGRNEPEKLVVLGNHRDAWTHGAVDPNSGTAAMLEMARGFGAALAAGWAPARTIVIASWDAEEYGLVGSTEWAEEQAADLQKHAIAYLNCDVAVTGPNLSLNGSPSLAALAMAAAADVADPRRGGSVGAAWEAAQRSAWATRAPVELDRLDPEFRPRLQPVGSGSDYTVFLDHLGVPIVDLGFSGSYGVYHSVYDNFRWMEKYGDPEFLYHAAAARLWGLMAMRLAGAPVLPLRFGNYAADLREDLDVLRRDVIRRARGLPGAGQKAPIEPDFAPILAALDELAKAGEAADRVADAAVERGDAAIVARLNDSLLQVERAFLDAKGLPGRPWFRHVLIAPGLTTGYAPWPFPALQQAVEERDAAMFAAESQRVVAAIKAGAARLWSAAK
jgi:N-acetylated-alpha-linked acidic dipeptidase